MSAPTKATGTVVWEPATRKRAGHYKYRLSLVDGSRPWIHHGPTARTDHDEELVREIARERAVVALAKKMTAEDFGLRKRGRPVTGCPKWDPAAKVWLARILMPSGGRRPVLMPGIAEHEVERAHAKAREVAEAAIAGGYVPVDERARLKTALREADAWTPESTIDVSEVAYESGVYFVQSAEPGNPIKIGVGSPIKARFRTLQTANAWTLVLRAWTPGGKSEEDALHARFVDTHIRGEWYRPSEELEALIRVAYRAHLLRSVDRPSWMDRPSSRVDMRRRVTTPNAEPLATTEGGES